VRGNDVPLTALSKIISLGASEIATGKLDIDVKAKGELGNSGLENASWNVNGRIASPQLTAVGIDLGLIEHKLEFDANRLSMSRLRQEATPDPRFIIDSFNATYAIEQHRYLLSDVDAKIFSGTMKGSATIARSENVEHKIDLRWNDLSPRLNTKALLPASVEVSMQTAGMVNWTAPYDSLNQPAKQNGEANFTVKAITIGSENVGSARLALTADDGDIDLRGDGKLLGGTFQVATQTELARDVSWWDAITDPSFMGTLKFEAIELQRVAALGMSDAPRLRGVVSGDVRLSPKQSGRTAALIALVVDNVAVDGALLARRTNINARLASDAVIVDSINGSYAGGRVEATGRIALPSGIGRLQVRMSSIDATRGLVYFSPTVASYIAGKLSGRLTVETGETLRARGAITVRDATLFNIPSGDAHATLMATAGRDLSRWQMDFRMIESSIGYGQLIGDAQLKSSSARPGAFDLKSDWQARRVDFGRLLDEVAGGGGHYARGNLNGTLSLNGTGVRSPSDLTGRFNAELDGSQARSIPGLISVQSYLGAASLVGTRFGEGGVRGSIALGAARINEFWLFSDRIQVLADGRIQLASGYVDMNAVVSTGNFEVSNIVISSLVQTAALQVALPISAIVRVNNALSNQTLFFEVRGPVTDPRLRLRPLDTLRRGATGLLINEAISTIIPIAGGNGALSSSSDR